MTEQPFKEAVTDDADDIATMPEVAESPAGIEESATEADAEEQAADTSEPEPEAEGRSSIW